MPSRAGKLLDVHVGDGAGGDNDGLELREGDAALLALEVQKAAIQKVSVTPIPQRRRNSSRIALPMLIANVVSNRLLSVGAYCLKKL